MQRSHGWEEISLPPLPPHIGIIAAGSKAFSRALLRVIVSQETREGHGDRLFWHLSISHRDRYPTWEEIKDARYTLLPMGLTFAQILPPMDRYTNIHPNCFHLWEIDWS